VCVGIKQYMAYLALCLVNTCSVLDRKRYSKNMYETQVLLTIRDNRVTFAFFGARLFSFLCCVFVSFVFVRGIVLSGFLNCLFLIGRSVLLTFIYIAEIIPHFYELCCCNTG